MASNNTFIIQTSEVSENNIILFIKIIILYYIINKKLIEALGHFTYLATTCFCQLHDYCIVLLHEYTKVYCLYINTTHKHTQTINYIQKFEI